MKRYCAEGLAVALLLSGFFGLGTQSAEAALAVSNLNIGAGTIVATTVHDPISESFTTGSGTGWTFDKLTLGMLRKNGADPATESVTVELLTDSSGSPGTLITTLSGPAIPITAGVAEDFDFTPDAATTFLPNTTYWVRVTGGAAATGNNGTYWSYQNNTSEDPNGFPDWTISDKGLINGFPYRFAVFATAGSGPSAAGNQAPVVAINGKKKIRVSQGPVVIKGNATDDSSVAAVLVTYKKVKANGKKKRVTKPAHLAGGFWEFKLLPKGDRIKLLIQAVDDKGLRSAIQKVTIIKQT